jgi:lipopolysaccharide export system permease protein
MKLPKLKRIDHLVVQSFWAPYLVSFFVAEFVLVMQFMWKYIDEILGKGFPLLKLFELIFYYAVTIIPTAIPLTILISSIMVYGNLSERYELTCMKSAGVSLLRVMRPAIIIALMTAGFSLLTSNNLKPKAYFSFYSLFRSISNQKPSLSLQEGIFNNDFKDYIIRIGKKEKDDEGIRDVLIYDHTDIDRKMVNVIHAESGRMYNQDGSFVMELHDGYQYKDLKASMGKSKKNNYPFMRTDFKSFTKVFDMTQFELDINTSSMARRKHELLNIHQLHEGIDSFEQAKLEKGSSLRYGFSGMFPTLDTLGDYKLKEKIKTASEEAAESITKDTLSETELSEINKSKAAVSKAVKNQSAVNFRRAANNNYELPLKSIEETDTVSSFINAIADSRRFDALEESLRESRSFYNNYNNTAISITNLERLQEMYNLKIHQQFSWAWMCVVFLFIGAPLGSIIRKGGYGYPLLIAIIFYVIFVITSISGDKLVRKGNVTSEVGAWFPVIILMPVAILVTYLALKDRKIDLVGFFTGLLPLKKELE